MNSHLVRLVTLSVSLLVATAPVMAHHSFAVEFDANQSVTVQGKVTRVAWTNPHVWIYLNVQGPDGKLVNWGFEMGAPHQVQNQGWTRELVKPGDELIVDGFRARNGSFRLNARKVTSAATGRVFIGLGAGGGAAAQ